MNNDELNRAVAEHERSSVTDMEPGEYPPYATSWEWTGPILERLLHDGEFYSAIWRNMDCEETLLRATCLAVLEVEK